MQKNAERRIMDASGPQLSPIERETVQDRVYAELRRALICGLFEPSQVLTIRGLADAMMTSTMPVREALGRLITEKAVEAMPNRSVRIPPVTLERLDDLLRSRILVEGEAIALATTRMTQRDITQARDMLAEWDEIRALSQRGDFDRESLLNQKFHFQIYRCSGSSVLIPMIESLWLQSGPCTRYAAYAFSEAVARDGGADVAHYHREMVAALESRHPERAREALIADISRPFAFLRDKLLAENQSEETP